MKKVTIPGQNVPIMLPDGQINPVWYQVFKAFEPLTTPDALSGASTLRGNPTGAPAAESDITLGSGLGFSGTTLAVVGKSDLTRTFNTQTGSTYTFQLSDQGKIVYFSNSTTVTAAVPPNSSVAFPIGTQIDLIQGGTPKVTIAAGAGVTITSVSGNKSLAASGAGATLVKASTDFWILMGSLIP